MFQLNNKKNVILIIAIFAVIAIIITTVLIIINKKSSSNDDDNKVGNKEIIKEKEKYGITSLTEKYVVYNLEYKYCDEDEREIKSISGLKNKEAEKKINQQISGCKYTSGMIIGNTMSFVEYNDNWDVISYLSLRLDTGEKYDFEDIFLAETSIEQLISQAVNYYYSCKYRDNGSICFRLYDWDYDEDKQPKKPADFDLEEEIFRIINIYRSEGVKQFYMGPNMIEVQIGDMELFLPTESVWQDLAIYKRFLTKESIFEQKSDLTNYVLSAYRGNKYNGFILDNLFLEVNGYENDEVSKPVHTTLMKQNEIIKNKIIEMAKNDKKNIYFLLIDEMSYFVDEEGYGNYSQINVYKINKKDYESLGGEEYLATEQRTNVMGYGFAFYDDYAKIVNIDDLIIANFKVMDKNSKVLNNYCHIEEDYYKIGDIVEVWNNKNNKYGDHLVEADCQLTYIN